MRHANLLWAPKPALAAAILALCACSGAAPPMPYASSGRLAPSPGSRLVWSDEFEQPGLPDPTKWSYDTEFNRPGWHNGERQYYSRRRAENTRVERGRLIIEAHAEQLDPARYPDWSGQRFTSARLVTRGTAQWSSGFFEIRARLPCARGSWPALWLLPAEPGEDWPNGEIDIMEHVGFDRGIIHHSVHTKALNFRNDNHPTARSRVPNACGAFHRYQLSWTPEALVIGVDGRAAFAYRKREAAGGWPFDQPFYLLMNVAVGGSWGGSQGIDTRAFPARMEVDYVRIYQPPMP